MPAPLEAGPILHTPPGRPASDKAMGDVEHRDAPAPDTEADKPCASASEKKPEKSTMSMMKHYAQLMTDSFGGDHATWMHPAVILIVTLTMVGCCYGIAQNWQKSVAARRSPGLRSGVTNVAAFPSWVAVVCTDTLASASGRSPLRATERPWNLALVAEAPPPPLVVGGKDAVPMPPPAPPRGTPSSKSLEVTRSVAVGAARHAAIRNAVANEARAALADFQAQQPKADGRRLQQLDSFHSSSSSSDLSGIFYSYSYGACAPYTSSASASATVNTTTCTANAPQDKEAVNFRSCWLYVQACGCTGDTLLRFEDNQYETQLGSLDDGGGYTCSASGSYDSENALCSAGATDISLYGISSGNAADVDIKQGCYSSNACGGQVLYYYACSSDPNYDLGSTIEDSSSVEDLNSGSSSGSVEGAIELTVVPETSDSISYAYGYGYCDSFNTSLTSYATTNVEVCTVDFDTVTGPVNYTECYIYVWGCGCSGDTYVRVEQASGSLIASMDDDSSGWCPAADSRCSSGNTRLPPGVTSMTLQQGCFADGTCGGSMQYYAVCFPPSDSAGSGSGSGSGSGPSGSGGSTSGSPPHTGFSAPPQGDTANSEAMYTGSSTDSETNTQIKYAYGGCDAFYQSTGSGFTACDIFIPQLDQSSTCEVTLYSCYCSGDTVLTIPSLGSTASVDDDALGLCPSDQSRCSTGVVTTNVSATNSTTRLTLRQQCFQGAASCGGSTSWTTTCTIQGGQRSTSSAFAPPTYSASDLSNVVSSGDYVDTPVNENAVGVYFTLVFENVARAALERNQTAFLRTVATALSTPAYTVVPSRITVISSFTDVLRSSGHRRSLTAAAAAVQTVQVQLSVLAPDVTTASRMQTAIINTLPSTLATAVPGATVTLFTVPTIGEAIFTPVILVGNFNTSATNPMKPGDLVFGTYPQEQCLQARASSLFLEADSHTMNSSGAAFNLDIVSNIDASLAIGFYALDEGEAALRTMSDFYILKRNASIIAVPRVSVAKKKYLRPYKASVNQVVAITQGQEAALYERIQWLFKLARLEVQSETVSSTVTANGKSTQVKTTTLQFHPFFFNFVVEVTEQYYTFDDVQAFTATITYITYFISILPLALKVPKLIRCIRGCMCCGAKQAPEHASEA